MDADAKLSEFAKLSESKADLESRLAQLTEAHSGLQQQQEELKAEMTQVQSSLVAAEEGRAAAEVTLAPC